MSTFRPVDYRLNVELDLPPENRPPMAPGGLTATAVMTLINDSPRGADRLPLLFYRLHDVGPVFVDGRPASVSSRLTSVSGEERRQVRALEVELSPPAEPGGHITVECRFAGIVAGAREVWPYIWDQVGREYTLLRPDVLWYPLPVPPESGALYGAFAHAFTGELAVKTPAGHKAVAAGEESEGETRFRWTAPRNRIDLAVAPFRSLSAQGVTVNHLTGCEAWGRDVLDWVSAATRRRPRSSTRYPMPGRPTPPTGPIASATRP